MPTPIPTIIAHRGASKEAPENTLRSITRAIEIGADYIELDVHLTKDHIPVIIHDASTRRTAPKFKERYVEETELLELQSVDVGSWFSPGSSHERIPTLKEVLAFDLKKSALMIEIKKGRLPARLIATAVVNELQHMDGNVSKKHFIGSFDPEIIKEVKKHTSNYQLMGIIENLQLLDSFIKMDLSCIAFWHQIVSKKVVEQLHNRGIQVWSFTVDDLDLSNKIIEMGIDGIITNDPRKFIDSKAAGIIEMKDRND